MVIDDTQRAVECPLYDALNAATFQFYLAGSRWMGGAKPDSDWDFLVQDSTDVRVWLVLHGFASRWAEHRPDTTDDCTTDVWERPGEPVIQVQLCPDVQRKHRVAREIRWYWFNRHLNMSDYQRSKLWSLLYRRYR